MPGSPGVYSQVTWHLNLMLAAMVCRQRHIISTTSAPPPPHHHLLSRLSKYPRSCLSMSLCARPCAFRSWRNSWWKCRRSFPIPRYSGLWSSTSTFPFLMVEDQFLVFMVFSKTAFNSLAFQKTHF